MNVFCMHLYQQCRFNVDASSWSRHNTTIHCPLTEYKDEDNVVVYKFAHTDIVNECSLYT